MIRAFLRRLFCWHPVWLKGDDPYWRIGLQGWVCAHCAKRIQRDDRWLPINYKEFR